MVIKSVAQLDELSSPYFLMNKEFCQDFEQFIASKSGMIKGSYNVWSYNITAKIPHKAEWILKCNKGTYASPGNLALSAKKQALRVTSTWSANNLISDSSDFKIKRKNFLHFFNKKWTPLTKNISYSIKGNQSHSKLQLSLFTILDDLLFHEKVMNIEYLNNKLKIEVDTEEIHKDVIDKLLIIS